MSTKAHIFNNEYIEAYTETSEPIIVFGKHQGYKTYILLSTDVKVTCDMEYFTISVKQKSMKFSAFIVESFEFHYDGSMFVISCYDYGKLFQSYTNLCNDLKAMEV